MVTHSSVLAWRIPGMGKPDWLPSLGSHRVRHDWSDLAAAAAIFIHTDHLLYMYLMCLFRISQMSQPALNIPCKQCFFPPFSRSVNSSITLAKTCGSVQSPFLTLTSSPSVNLSILLPEYIPHPSTSPRHHSNPPADMPPMEYCRSLLAGLHFCTFPIDSVFYTASSAMF